ncbi:MAG: TetR/AcrR family transcriptional regulator [Candidatus Dormiibacterota bacterium]
MSRGAPGTTVAARPQRAEEAGNSGTAMRILSAAERLVQTRGFNGFSYADIATELHITTAALHYHFATKAELGEALIAHYSQSFSETLTRLDNDLAQPADKLAGYSEVYLEVLRAERMCLCGMLAAEYQTLPEPMQHAVVRFFDANESWLERVLVQGQSDGTLKLYGPARDIARMIIGGLEGAMMVARACGDIRRFQDAATRLIGGLTVARDK